MKTILVPTDFSVPADYAIHYAIELSKKFNSSIILYHAFIPFESGFYSHAQSTKENLETENNLIKRLDKIKEGILKTNQQLSVSIHVDRGPESIRLVEFCIKKKIDLIVMGTTGASGLKEVIIGSFAADTMTKAPCSVLAIPKGCKFKSPKKITFASDYSENDSLSIKFLTKWHEAFKSKICLLHIDDSEYTSAREEEIFTDYKRKLEKQCEGIALSFQHTKGTDISKAILHITLNDKTDILAIAPEKRKGFWNNILHKSITKTTAYHIRIPLLSITVK
jgi:nucleotide-binding universal stress UspA family protein